MTNKWVAIVSVLLLSGTVAVADDWAGKMKTVDTDGSGTVSRNEWNTNSPKLKSWSCHAGILGLGQEQQQQH